MICWYCYWGWACEVADLYEAAAADIGEHILEYGPSHVVLCDENFEDGSIDFCIKACDDPMYDGSYELADLEKLKGWLLKLKAIPESVRCCEPEAYAEDGDHPGMFPPTIPVRHHK